MSTFDPFWVCKPFVADVMIPRKRALFRRGYENNTVFGLDSEIFYFLHERLLIFMVSRRSAIP